MRKVIWMMSVSLDGFFEGPNRELDWHLVDNELHTHFNDELRSMGAFLEGRVTYELMASYWPTADEDPMFGPSDMPLDLRLVETRTFGNGVVLLRYQRPPLS